MFNCQRARDDTWVKLPMRDTFRVTNAPHEPLLSRHRFREFVLTRVVNWWLFFPSTIHTQSSKLDLFIAWTVKAPSASLSLLPHRWSVVRFPLLYTLSYRFCRPILIIIIIRVDLNRLDAWQPIGGRKVRNGSADLSLELELELALV